MQKKMGVVCGFSLIELLIVVLIFAIIAKIAISSFVTYELKGRRSDGINAVLAVSLGEERYRSTNATYGTLANVYSGSTSPQGYYNLAVTVNTATNYTITATATGNQTSDAESGTSCSTLTLTVVSGTITKTPAACWPS